MCLAKEKLEPIKTNKKCWQGNNPYKRDHPDESPPLWKGHLTM